jgi:hypothetical protein
MEQWSRLNLLSQLKRTVSVTRQYRVEAFVNNIICLSVMTYKKFGEMELMLIQKCSLQTICRKSHPEADFPHRPQPSTSQTLSRQENHYNMLKSKTNVPIEK